VKDVVSILNFMLSHGRNYRQFQFLSEIDAEYGDVLYLAKVQWLNRGIFLALRPKIEMFMNEKGKVVVEHSGNKWP
jgi:hypothetical protein